MTTSLRDVDQVASHLRGQGEDITLIEGGISVPAEVTLKVKSAVQILWGDVVVFRTPLGLDVPAELRDKTLALAKQINADVEAGAFVLGPPLAFEVRLERDADGGVAAIAVEDALDASRNNVLTYYTHFAPLLTPRPAPPPPAAVTIGSKPVTLTATEVARLRAACEAGWRPFLHRVDGRLDCYEKLQPWWKKHRVIDVTSPLPMPAVGLMVAIGPDGAVAVLRGHLEHLVEMAAKDPPPPLTDADQARAYAYFCDSATTDAQWGELPVASFDEIPFRQLLTPEEKTQIHELRMKHGADMHAPRFEKTGDGFVLKVWKVSMSRLVYRELAVPPDGQLGRKETVVADPIPVPPGKAWAQSGNRFVPVA